MTQTLTNKTLVSFCSYNAPQFLEHLMDTIEQHDAGSPFDLLILDNSSTDRKQRELLERYSKKYRIEVRPNYGRAQGGYDHAWQNNKNYKYYFFMHDDSAVLCDNWLKVAVDRMEEPSLAEIGKVGFQAYEWGDKYRYTRTGHQQIFHYMDPIAKFLQIEIPELYQHVNDDRYLIKNELLQKMGHIWSVEDWKQLELCSQNPCSTCGKGMGEDPHCSNGYHRNIWSLINQWFEEYLPNRTLFAPNERYGWRYHAFQTVSEFLSDIAPMRYGYRTKCVIGNGYCQEELGWSSFWGLEYINHYGCHNFFKRIAILLGTTEESVRLRCKDKNFLHYCDNIVKRETKYVDER